MNPTELTGKRIAMLRKEKGMSQEQLAERLQVSAQAVSKWETGKALPETATLPLLSRALGHSIDSLLMPQELIILSAVYTDGSESHDVTSYLNSFITGSRLTFPVNEHTLPYELSGDRIKVLLVKYELPSGIHAAYVRKGKSLAIDSTAPGVPLQPGELIVMDAFYGNEQAHRNVMKKLQHYQYFRWESFTANHELFPSLIGNDGPDYLLFVYRNAGGIHAISCREGESLRFNSERTELLRSSSAADNWIVEGIEPLAFGQGRDCSWGGAMLAALKAYGEDTSYEEVMGVSGACWRVAFTPHWDYSSADALVAYDYAAPAFAAYGIAPVWSDRIGPEARKEEKQRIMADLRRGRLPVAINLRVAPEWGVITGYLDNGNTLLCRSFFDQETFDELKDDPDFQAEMRKTKGYLHVDHWPFALVRFGDQGPVPSPLRNLIRSLQVRLESMGMADNRGYRLGYAALQTWRDGLLDEEWYSRADASDFARRLSVNHFCMQALVDARRCAAVYLQEALSLSEMEPVIKPLAEMAAGYKEMLPRLEAFYDGMPSGATVNLFPTVKQAWSQEQRIAQAELLDVIIHLEQLGDKWARQIVDRCNPL
ncbi:helix-turn-helix domain-containing protein [Gorillibacterium timonense]|uniref:helix-turn-helix domain-containing protein n=1 Tax=Gorillibacterium timonense TaxID=1689269 RepID=UPI00071CADFB|nr:helix-turn-helix transcriptional regulator [Gorillibacterium timonense]